MTLINIIKFVLLFHSFDYCKESNLYFARSSVPKKDEKTIEAIKNIAYYLRAHKFNEWDRRYYTEKPKSEEHVGYFKAFPEPPLKSLHWDVSENCNSEFYTCINYLNNIIESAPVARRDDTTALINDKVLKMNDTLRDNLYKECIKGFKISETTGLPFDGPLERFQWKTSASYYMCWYTMLETPALSILEEQCDNHANCWDDHFGQHNRDVRSNDHVSFACAAYSFCPDSCCPIKTVKHFDDCYNSESNPCFHENIDNVKDRICSFDRKANRDLRSMMMNKWNFSCHCSEKGFIWNPQYGLCVDVDECVSGKHNCDVTTQNCVNLPGSFACVCSFEYDYDNKTSACIHNPIINLSEARKETRFGFSIW